jgi:two-component system, cell cycle response regulator DivK
MNEPILIVDDNPMNLKLCKRLLEGEHYQVLTSKNAEETLKLLERFHPKLILMDFQLPGMDGVDLTRKIRSNPENQKMVILMVTSNDLQGDEAKAKAAGCDGYIQKPINTQTLPGIIAGYLRKDSNGTGKSGKPEVPTEIRH